MKRFAEIQAHIASMDELLDIVGAMRSLAGMRIQEAQRAVPGVRRYAESMAAAIGAALLALPERAEAPRGGGRRALVLFAAEHGFVGGFNERLIEAAGGFRSEGDALFVLGSRGAAVAIERGLKVEAIFPMATRPPGAPETVRRLTDALYPRIARGEIGRIEMVFERNQAGQPEKIERHTLLPFDVRTVAVEERTQAPLCNLAPEALVEKLISEYVFALLTDAAIESIASENAARFAAMESAHDNVSKKLETLRRDARQARQSEITTELIDVVTGAEALAGQ